MRKPSLIVAIMTLLSAQLAMGQTTAATQSTKEYALDLPKGAVTVRPDGLRACGGKAVLEMSIPDSNGSDHEELSLLDLKSGKLARIGRDIVRPIEPKISSDGKYVAATSFDITKEMDRQTTLYLLDTETGKSANTVQGCSAEGCWFGQKFLFATASPKGSMGNIAAYDPKTQKAEQLPVVGIPIFGDKEGKTFLASVSPKDPKGKWRLAIFDAQGKLQKELFDADKFDPGKVFSPTWRAVSPSIKYLAFQTPPADKANVPNTRSRFTVYEVATGKEQSIERDAELVDVTDSGDMLVMKIPFESDDFGFPLLMLTKDGKTIVLAKAVMLATMDDKAIYYVTQKDDGTTLVNTTLVVMPIPTK